jgi:hypothetical protein
MASAEQELFLVRPLALEEQTVHWPGSWPQKNSPCSGEFLSLRRTGVAVAWFLASDEQK